MKCCNNCFSSEYLKQIISTSPTSNGKCDFCKSKSSSLIYPKKLNLYFKNIFDLYVSSDNPKFNPDLIEKKILADFPSLIFNLTDENKVKHLLVEIIADDFDDYQDIFKSNVILEYLEDPLVHDQAEILKVSWDNFSKEIKSENRYHLNNVIDLSKLERLLKRNEKEYKKDSVFYRARISDLRGYDLDKMGNPPSHKAKAGRANPEAISYLYLSNNIETTLYETRAYLYDYITIGTFELTSDITIINLRETKIYDPMFLSDEDVLIDFLSHLPFMLHLENELSKPIRKNENVLDYYPTQYLSEFIKSIGYDGVEYASSLNPAGFNIALFSPKKIKCNKTVVKEINKMNLDSKEV